jgi:hypothetical protein
MCVFLLSDLEQSVYEYKNYHNLRVNIFKMGFNVLN